jgi:predicted nucleic acid-binding protein
LVQPKESVAGRRKIGWISMNSKFVLETSAWIEYFDGTKLGERCKDIIEQGDISTSIITLVELFDRLIRKCYEVDAHINFVLSRARIIPISRTIGKQAAICKNEMTKEHPQFGSADGIHLPGAIHKEVMLITKDNDFAGLKNVMLLR